MEGPLRFVRIWLHPQVPRREPEYEAMDGPMSLRRAGQPGATLHIARSAMRRSDAEYVYMHVVSGDVRLGGQTLGEGDAARITHAQGLVPEAGGPECLGWEMHGAPVHGTYGKATAG